MKSFEFDTAIIGGGCLGSSILHELIRRGFSNVGLIDQGRKSISATANSGGMLRVFHERLEHVDLALANHLLLKKHQDAGIFKQKYEANGSLYFFNKHRFQYYQMNLKRMRDAHYDFEVLTTISGRKRFPEFHWNEDEWAIYEPLGAQLSPNLFLDELISSSVSLQSGSSLGSRAELINDFQVQRLSFCGDHYRIFGNDGTIATKTLILAGGARLLPRLRDLGLSLCLEAKSIITFAANRIEGSMILPNYFDRETLEFARLGRNPDVLLSNPKSHRVLNGPKYGGETNSDQGDRVSLWQGPFEQKVAEDCYAPDRMGYSGQVSGYPQLILATGWGGTGFKFALAIGNRVATAVEQGCYSRSPQYRKLGNSYVL